ncbi:MAG: hypothetical protein ACJAZN_002220 [Planctomycetota bacterium]|jgi:hypothetical protein
MIRKVFLGSVLWTILISFLHVQLNVGWGELLRKVQVQLGEQPQGLVVGFLPVT